MKTPLPETYRIPAEWEPQEAVYFATPPGNEFDPSQFASGNSTVEDVQFRMIEALHEHVTVRILASNESEVAAYRTAMQDASLPADWVEFHLIEHCDIWLRDTGPIWAKSDSGETALVWMGFNNWGYAPYITGGDWGHCDIPNYIPRDLGGLLNKQVYRSPLIGEGGDKSFNGQGCLICCKAVERDRNPNLSLQELEATLASTFNLQKVIWVERGLAEDYQTFRIRPDFGRATLPENIFTPICTGGHVDEFCRFVDTNRVLLAQVHESTLKNMSAIDQITHSNMEGNLAFLQQQTDQDGAPLEIVGMPLPPNMIYTVDQRDPTYAIMQDLRGVDIAGPIQVVLAASYCNYLVSNGVVCFPQYFQPGVDPIIKEIDQQAFDVISSVFPQRQIVPINPIPLNAGGGGMHCISNNQPVSV